MSKRHFVKTVLTTPCGETNSTRPPKGHNTSEMEGKGVQMRTLAKGSHRKHKARKKVCRDRGDAAVDSILTREGFEQFCNTSGLKEGGTYELSEVIAALNNAGYPVTEEGTIQGMVDDGWLDKDSLSLTQKGIDMTQKAIDMGSESTCTVRQYNDMPLREYQTDVGTIEDLTDIIRILCSINGIPDEILADMPGEDREGRYLWCLRIVATVFGDTPASRAFKDWHNAPDVNEKP